MIPIGMAWVPINPRKFKKFIVIWLLLLDPQIFRLLLFYFASCHIVSIGTNGTHTQHIFSGKLLFLLDEFVRLTCLTSALYGFNLIPIPPLDGSKVLHFSSPKGKDIMNNLSHMVL